jgi:hypothetical protein
MSSEMKKGSSGADMIEELNEDFDTFESWVIEHWRIIAAACVGIVVLVAAIGIGMAIQKSSARKTAQLFATADTYDKLTEALKANPSSNYAPDARMKLAMMQVDKKDYAPALANFKEIADSSRASEVLRFRASLNSAYVLELQGKNDEAIALLSSLGQNALAPEDIRFEANYGAGRLLANKKEFDKARSALSKAVSARPRSMGEFLWSSQAKSLLERIPAAPKKG